MKIDRIGLIVATLRIVWLSAALVRVESERYAMQVSMCWDDTLKLPDLAGIQKAQTRYAWYWHLFFALKG